MQRWWMLLLAVSSAAVVDHAALAQTNPELPPPEEPRSSEHLAPPPGVDGVRFRVGGSAVFGGIVFPDDTVVGLGGIQGTFGVQINHVVGVYAVPGIELVFGDIRGLSVSAAAMIDFTIAHVFTIGGGFDVGAYAGAANNVEGAMYGGRIHMSVQPTGAHAGARRFGPTIGFDLRLLAVHGSLEAEYPENPRVDGLAIAPNITIGGLAF